MSISYTPTPVLNVSKLFSINARQDEVFQTLGYSTKGVGGNLYRYDSGSAATIDGGFVLPGVGGLLSFSGITFDGTAGTGRFLAVDQSVANVQQFGGTNDAIKRALQKSTVLFPSGVYTVGSLNISNGTYIFQNATLVPSGNLTPLTVGSNCTLHDLKIDLAGISTRAVAISSSQNVRFKGTTLIENALGGGANTDGAIIMASCSGISFDRVRLNNILQNSGAAGLYRGMDISSSNDIHINDLLMVSGDICLNLYASTNVMANSIYGKNLSDNGIYIINATSSVSIDSANFYNCGEGIVLDSSATNALTTIGDLTVSNASAYGITWRQGGGYFIGGAHLIECPFATSTSGVRDGLTIGSLRIYYTGTTTRCMTISDADNLTIMGGEFSADTPLSSYAALVTDCDNLLLNLSIKGVGASALTEGIRFTASALTNPKIVSNINYTRVTTPYTVNAAITDQSEVFVKTYDTHYGDLTIKKNTPVILQLENTDTTMAAGDDIASLVIYGRDSTLPGQKFRLLTEAQDTSGASRTWLYNDSGVAVGYIPANATNAGMTIKLPTSTTGLSTGMLYNSGGIVSIVP